jgi:GNAT superfamily N-acetyltransferase
MIVVSEGSIAHQSSPTMRIVDMDVKGEHHQKVVLKLCESGQWHHNDVWVRLYNTLPPNHGLSEKDLRVIDPAIEAMKKRADKTWTLCGLLAIDKTTTGVEKVVGFTLYIIAKETKNNLEILFVFVNKNYRKRGHATNMMKTVQDRHLGTYEWGEKCDGLAQSRLGYDLVHFIQMEVVPGSAVVSFYKTLGLAIASEVPGWKDTVGKTSSPHLLMMVDAGPVTWDRIVNEALLFDAERERAARLKSCDPPAGYGAQNRAGFGPG